MPNLRTELYPVKVWMRVGGARKQKGKERRLVGDERSGVWDGERQEER